MDECQKNILPGEGGVFGIDIATTVAPKVPTQSPDDGKDL